MDLIYSFFAVESEGRVMNAINVKSFYADQFNFKKHSPEYKVGG